MPTPTPAPSAALSSVEETVTSTLSFLEGLSQYLWDLVQKFWNALPQIVVHLLGCVLVWLLARFLVKLISKRTGKVLSDPKLESTMTTDQYRRTKSVMTLTRSASRYVVYFFAIMAILMLLGVSSQAALAGAGVGSLAIGFGAQNLVKDVISGFFMVFENQYAVGDYIKLNTDAGQVEGVVEAIAMRVTYLRNNLGQQIIVPNGTINQVVNCTRGSWKAVVDVPVAYEADLRQVSRVILEVAERTAAEMPEAASGTPEVLGVQEFGDSAILIRVACPAHPTKQWSLERQMRQRIKEAFDELGIEIPYSKTVLFNGDAQQQPDPDEQKRHIEEWIAARPHPKKHEKASASAETAKGASHGKWKKYIPFQGGKNNDGGTV